MAAIAQSFVLLLNRARVTGGAVSLILVGAFTASSAAAQQVVLEERDAVVWLEEQTIRGYTEGVTDGTLFINTEPIPFDVVDGSFAVPVKLRDGENVIVACAGDDSHTTCSDTLRWSLAYELRPEVYAYAATEGGATSLHAQVLENPSGSALTFSWQADPDNPGPTPLADALDSVATATLTANAAPGEYYFNLSVTDENDREGRARTFVTVDESGVVPFDIWSDHAAWVDEAIVYEVTPYIFHSNGKWSDVAARLQDIAGLGINTLWIQPVFKTHGRGQGYDITNYFQLRDDLGTENDLRELVRTAKEDFGMRVLFDFVPNHTAIQHPYAQDAVEHGPASHYYDFYLREGDDAPYSRHYNRLSQGQMDFIYYFWDDLVIIDYSNPEVYRWMMEAGRHWVERFDIDGYRIDAVWGVNARTPEAMENWRFDLKRLKPEIFLLGEDKATWPTSFERKFDAAFDWYSGEGWVSQWTWQADFRGWSGRCHGENPTIFNAVSQNARSSRLRHSLTNGAAGSHPDQSVFLYTGWHPDAKVFRFLENNDTFRFLHTHGLERTRMAAGLLFTLPGIPMIYNGQEIGFDCHPYSTGFIFRRGERIRDQDPHGLYPFYNHLATLRSHFKALASDSLQEISVDPDAAARYVYSFRRWEADENIIVAVNMADSETRVSLTIPIDEINLDPAGTYYLTDLFSGDYISASGEELTSIELDLPGYSTRIMSLADHVVDVPTSTEPVPGELPAHLALEQNYPNPFNPQTTIRFEMPVSGHVRLTVFDVLGREVRVLVEGDVPPGSHEVLFDAEGLTSGMYFYRLEAAGRSVTKQMTLVR